METKGKLFLRAVLAGICIGIGGTVYLACSNQYIGACLFSIGLFFILTRGFALYTGMVCYLPGQFHVDSMVRLVVTVLGNLVGTAIIGLPLSLTRQKELCQKAADLCAVKLEDSYLSLLILSIGCGIIIYLAVDGFKRANDPLIKVLGIFLGVPVFILCGMEHSIADMYYIFAGMAWGMKAVMSIVVIIIGNGIGGVLIPLIDSRTK